MLIFPQLASGAVVQYPSVKSHVERIIRNLTEDGKTIVLSDNNARTTRWNLAYNALTDSELYALTKFYTDCEGPLQPFLFLDPTQNLIAFSEDYRQPNWVGSSLLNITPGIDDPFGTLRASRITNNSQAALALTQSLALPGVTQCAFSAYLRSYMPADTTGCILSRTDGSSVATVPSENTASWKRVSLSSGFFSSTSDSCDFSIGVPGGSSVDLFGLQVDAQPSPAPYVVSTNNVSIFQNARFDSTAVTITATDLGQSSVTVSVIARTHG